MSQDTIYKNLTAAHSEIEKAIFNARKAALEYEVFISDLEHKNGSGVIVENPENYFSNLLQKNSN